MIKRVVFIAALALSTRVLVFGAGALAVATVGFGGYRAPAPTSDNFVLDLPARWDTGWYIGVAHGGYRWNGRLDQYQNIAFFPAYPLLFKAFATLLGAGHDPVAWAWAGVLLSTILLVCALLLLHKLAVVEIGPEGARAAVALAATYPFAIFFGLPYTESLFLLALVGTFERLRNGAPIAAAAFAFLAGFTRPNGWLLSAPLALFVIGAQDLFRTGKPASRQTIGRLKLSLVAASPILAAGLYSAYVYWLTGRPLAWAEVQDTWGRGVQNPVKPFADILRQLSERGASAFWESQWHLVVNLCATLFALAAFVPVTRRLGLASGALVLVGCLAPLAAGGLPSTGRYTSVLFPLFLWLAAVLRSSWPLAAILFAAGQALVAAWFFTWRPIY